MRIHIWKGFHSPQILELIQQTWMSDDQLLILCPPALRSFDFVRYLPPGEIEWHGEWTNPPTVDVRREKVDYPAAPKLGVFTSGTTNGIPKLVLYSRENILSSLKGILKFFEPAKIDSIFCYPQPFHTFGLLLGYVLSIEKKWPLHTGEGKYSNAFHRLRLENASAGMLTLGTPTHFQDLLTLGGEAVPTYSCIVGGASVSVALWKRLRAELKIAEPSIGYGATEASPGILHLAAGSEPQQDGEIGTTIEGIEISAPTESGYEFSGPSACMAIVHRDRVEFPKKVFISDKIAKRQDGVFTFHGRADFVLNRGGEKFSLESIEEMLKEKLNVRALAFTVPHPRLGQELGLLLLGDISAELIASALHEKFLVKFDTSYFKSVSRFPLNGNLKPDRRAAVESFRL